MVRAPRLIAVGGLLAAACGATAPRAVTPPGPAPVRAPPAAAPGVEPVAAVIAPAVVAPPVAVEVDRGELVMTVRGRPAGTETFSIEDGGADGGVGHVIRSEVRLESGATLRLLDSVLITDRDWRPVSATARDVVDGGTRRELAGAPLTLTTRARLTGETVRTASRAVELYLGDNTLAHFAPACALPAPLVRVGFPGMDVRIGGDVATALAGVTRRPVDLAGTVRATVTCEAGRMLAVELPAFGLAAVRRERRAELAAVVLPTASKAPLPPGLIELDRQLAVRGATLACSLVLPATRPGPAPVAVLLSGSGAQDRDEDTLGPGGIKLGILRAVALTLGAGGVASLRCDDRGVGGSTGEFGAATLDTFLADARALVAAVRAEPAVDRARVSVIGHSEGAVVAALVAAADPGVAAVALLAGPGRPVDEVLLEQVGRTLGRGGLTADEATAALDRHRAAFAAIRAGQPLPDTDEANEWRGGEAWLRSHLGHDVLAALTAVGPRPVFVGQGGVDRQVIAADADALARAARAGGAAVVDRRYPGLDHLFARSDTGDPSAYVDPDRRVDPAVLADLLAFVVAAPAVAPPSPPRPSRVSRVGASAPPDRPRPSARSGARTRSPRRAGDRGPPGAT